ncbi:RnfABCDGE type electron transport complex subunit G [Gehongia tenuis]
MGESFRMVSRLALIALVAGLFLGGTYYITKEPIAEQERMQAQQARQEVLPAAEDFEKLDMQNDAGIEEIYAGKANGGIVGYTVKLTSKGYGGDIVMTVGVNEEGVTGVKINSHSETPGLGAKADAPIFMNQYVGKAPEAFNVAKGAASGDDDILAISGATITSRAVTDGVNTVLELYRSELEGGQ